MRTTTPKYKLTKNTITVDGHTLYQIQAVTDIYDHPNEILVAGCGAYGGHIESEANLDQAGCCWVRPGSLVCENAFVCGRSIVGHQSVVCGNAIVQDQAKVMYGGLVLGRAKVKGNAQVIGKVVVGEDTVIT